jgi:multiple sugar transport system substrate-binding protein
LNNKIKSVALATVLALAVGGAGSISADAATKKPTAKPAAKKPAAKKPAAKPAADPKPAVATTAVQKEAAALNASGKKFTYWIGLIFSDIANSAAQDQIKSWGKSRGIQVDPVLVNQNNLTAQTTAALAAGTMPDAMDISSGLMLQLGSKNLLNIQSLTDEMAKKYGGWNAAAAVFDEKGYVGKGLGLPYGISGNLINRRLDLLKDAGAKTTAPKTWEELMEAATKTMKVGGAGFALGNVGDAETVFRAQFVGYGGRYADDAGKKCTIDAPATRDFLAFVKKWYDKGAYPTSAVTTDGGWDNNLYLGGKTVFIANPGSVYTTLLNGSAAWPKNPTLAKNTGFSALPGGPKARVAPSNAWLRAIPATTKYPELAKDLIRFLMDTRNMQEYYEWAIYGPALKDHNKFNFWDENVDPVHGGLYDLAVNGTSDSFPDANNAAFAAFGTGFNLSKMVQRHLLDGDSADKTIKEAQAVCQTLYDK